MTSSNPPRDAPGTQGARASGIQAGVPEGRGSLRFELRNAQVDIITNDKCKKEDISRNPYDSPLPGPLWLAKPPSLFWGPLARSREGGRERGSGSDSGANRDSSWWLLWSCPRGGRAGARGWPPLAPGPAERGGESGAGQKPPVSARAPPKRALFPRELVLYFPSASLQPAAQLFTRLFPGRTGTGRVASTRTATGLQSGHGPYLGAQAAFWAPKAGGRLQARPRRPGAWRTAWRAGRTAAARRFGPAHSPGYL